jgi:hypothetical protein
MSAPIQNDGAGRDRERDAASIYAPPWARDAATEATDAAIAATEKLRNVLPPAPLLKDPEVRTRRRPPAAFEGDVALRELRARSPLDPDVVPEPPRARSRRSTITVLARLSGAVALAALAAIFVVGGTPGSPQGTADESAQPFWSRLFGANIVRETLTAPKPAERRTEPKPVERRAEPVTDRPVPMMERFAAATPAAEPPVPAVQPQQQPQAAEPPAPQPQPQPQVSQPAPPLTLDREEIAALYKRGEQLITQGDVAAARLMFTRAAVAGDARSALALGASYDPDVLRKLGVIGVAGDPAMAREWYAKASSYGSREAAQRIELMAHGR